MGAVSTSASTIRRVPTAAWWFFALIAAAFLLAATSFTTGDADSRVYITIASKLVSEPLHRWIAPQWWGAWGMQHGDANQALLDELLAHVDAGTLHPTAPTTFGFEQAPDALHALLERQVTGKVALVP